MQTLDSRLTQNTLARIGRQQNGFVCQATKLLLSLTWQVGLVAWAVGLLA